MAKRPVFKAVAVFPYVEVIQTEFIYFPGFSPSQAQKSAESLHHSYLEKISRRFRENTRSFNEINNAFRQRAERFQFAIPNE